MNLLHGKEEPNEDEMFKLVSSVKKVEVFSNCHNMNAWNIWESLFDMMARFKDAVTNNEEFKVPIDAIKSAISSCYYGLIWDQRQIESTPERNSAEDVQNLRKRLDRFMGVSGNTRDL